MKVLGIVGSPRKGGNTDVLMDEALRGAASAGATTEKIFLADLDINPCRGCNGCVKTGVCVQHDDMPGLLEKLFASDVWILGTPIYWWGPTAQMKAFVDRWYAPMQVSETKAKMKKRVALISSFGDSDPSVARHTVGMFADSLAFLGATFESPLLVSADKRGEVAQNERAMSDALALGAKLARE